jgi:hypothetical protein
VPEPTPPALHVARVRACTALAALAEHELNLVRTEAFAELETVHEERLALLAVLETPGGGGPLDDAAEAALQGAMRTQLLAAEAMRQGCGRLAAQLQHSGHARRAAAGYAAAAQR